MPSHASGPHCCFVDARNLLFRTELQHYVNVGNDSYRGVISPSEFDSFIDTELDRLQSTSFDVQRENS